MKSFLREPLLHFLLIGAALFVLFEQFDEPDGAESVRVVITNGEIEFLKASFARTRQRPPTEKEMQGLIDSYIREEVLYREALALGLDKNDTVIRRRMKQKMELMSDDIAGITVPSDDELRQFMETHPENFLVEPRVSFRQVFIDPSQRGPSADEEAYRLLKLLMHGGSGVDPDNLGDRLMLPKSFNRSPESDIARVFGKRFSGELLAVESGRWTGPVLSGYGLHLILVTEHIPGRMPALEEIREAVEWEWSAAHRKRLRDSIYEEILRKYTIEFEQPTTAAGDAQQLSMVQAGGEERQ